MKKKSFKSIKRNATHVLSTAGTIAVKITDKLTVFVKPGTDVEQVRAKYSAHNSNSNSYAPSFG